MGPAATYCAAAAWRHTGPGTRPEDSTIVPQTATTLPPSPADARAAWRADLWQRFRSAWFLKMTATTLGISGFFVAYFWVLHHPPSPPTVMPLTALDHLIVYQPAALPVYLSLWVYVSLAPALLKDARELASYGLATTALSVVGLGTFLAWPTAVPAFDIDWTQHPSIQFLKTVDVASNACPSLHVAFAVFTSVWLERVLREMGTGVPLRVFNVLWCAGILYSTLATRQHVVLDVLAGVLLGGAAVALHLAALRPRGRVAARP